MSAHTHERAPIREFMTPAPVTIGREQSLELAQRRMREHDIRHLPVLEGGRIIGILSDRELELVESLPGVDAHTTRVEEAMVADPYTVDPDTPLRDVIRYMAEHKFGTAVVAGSGGRELLGIFTTIDALAAFAAHLRGPA